MKIYNPFKPHIVEFTNGKFAVRKYEFMLGFVYKDREVRMFETQYYWWWDHKAEFTRHYQVDTIEQAKELLSRKDPKDVPVAIRVVKEVHV